MIRKGFLALAFVSLLLPVVVLANPWERKLPFKQATISYDLSGMETGREILYIKDHGRQTARYRTTTTSVLGMTTKNEKVEITTPDWIYSFDLQERFGTKSVNPQKIMIEEFNKLSADEKKKVEQNAEKMGSSMMSGMKGSVEQNAKEIMGFSCDRATVMGTTVYSIHGTPIALYTEANMMGVEMRSVASSVDKGSVDESRFNFPAGIEPQANAEADQMARVMAEQTIAMLKDPDNFNGGNGGTIGAGSGQQHAIPAEDKKEMEAAMKALKGLFGN